MSRKRKLIIWVIVVVAVVVVGSLLLKGKGGPKSDAMTVRVEKPILGDLTEFVSAPGEIEAKKNVEISAKVSARVLELPYKEGAKVTAGDPAANPPVPASVLIRLDSRDLESQLTGAQANYDAQVAQLESDKARLVGQKADLARIDATFEQAKKDLARQQGLLASKDVSEQTFDQAKVKVDELVAQRESMVQSMKAAEMSLEVLRHQLDAAKARIDQAKDALSYTTIVSPIDGTVTRVNAEVGELVVYGTMNNAGTVIMEVADLSQMIVAAQADETERAKLKVGQKAKVHIQAFPDKVFDGEVLSIALANSTSMQSRLVKYYRTEVLLDSNGLPVCSGFNADVDIETDTYKDVLKVPSHAVLSREVEGLPKEARDKPEVAKTKTYTTVVYVMKDGKAMVMPVKTGASDLTDIVISSGLAKDDMVIVGPYKVLEKIKHDDSIKEEGGEKNGKDKKAVKK
jgi:HlyD family secretion protein